MTVRKNTATRINPENMARAIANRGTKDEQADIELATSFLYSLCLSTLNVTRNTTNADIPDRETLGQTSLSGLVKLVRSHGLSRKLKKSVLEYADVNPESRMNALKVLARARDGKKRIRKDLLKRLQRVADAAERPHAAAARSGAKKIRAAAAAPTNDLTATK